MRRRRPKAKEWALGHAAGMAAGDDGGFRNKLDALPAGASLNRSKTELNEIVRTLQQGGLIVREV